MVPPSIPLNKLLLALQDAEACSQSGVKDVVYSWNITEPRQWERRAGKKWSFCDRYQREGGNFCTARNRRMEWNNGLYTKCIFDQCSLKHWQGYRPRMCVKASSPRVLRNPHSFWAASCMSRPNFTAKKGSDCGQIDATRTLCFVVSHFWKWQWRGKSEK